MRIVFNDVNDSFSEWVRSITEFRMVAGRQRAGPGGSFVTV
jgi:hypothetical protein